MTTYTNTGKKQLKINELTKTQMNNASTLSSTELYLVDPEFLGNKVLKTSGSGDIEESGVTATELGYLSGVTSTIQTQLNDKVASNTAITGSTKCKITYDSKGLVTAGSNLQASDIPDLSSTYQGALTGSTITLSSANWSSSTQTVTVSGMTSSAFVWVSPTPASASDYASAGVLCTAQGTNSLTFTCDTSPSSDISVEVVFG